MKESTVREYAGIIPAIAVPFMDDFRVNEIGLASLARRLADTGAIAGVLTNGHTGELFALTPPERAQVTRIVADELAERKDVPVISAVSCEGIADAVAHAVMAKEAGARAVMLMPPHHWLRFGYRPDYVVDYFDAVADATSMDLFVHVYPAWTRASYSSELLARLAKKPYIKVFKVGTRDMNRYAQDIAAIRAADPTKTILTCHDEYLLPTMVQGVDGALVGFGSLIATQINQLFQAVQRGDLQEAQRIQKFIDPLKNVIYGGGEPTGEAHSRLKEAMRVAGMIESAIARPPTMALDNQEKERIRAVVESAGLADSVASSVK